MQNTLTNQEILSNLTKRLKSENLEHYQETVREIINQVKLNGNKALAYYCEKFDHQKIDISASETPFTRQKTHRKIPQDRNEKTRLPSRLVF
jgi:histidinol dehydrogenase